VLSSLVRPRPVLDCLRLPEKPYPDEKQSDNTDDDQSGHLIVMPLVQKPATTAQTAKQPMPQRITRQQSVQSVARSFFRAFVWLGFISTGRTVIHIRSKAKHGRSEWGNPKMGVE
jgi:hypothetical protein